MKSSASTGSGIGVSCGGDGDARRSSGSELIRRTTEDHLSLLLGGAGEATSSAQAVGDGRSTSSSPVSVASWRGSRGGKKRFASSVGESIGMHERCGTNRHVSAT